MPKIFGTNILGILVASIAFFMLGWLWYGIVFQEMWMKLAGITQTEPDPMVMVWGFVITVIQVLGIAYVIKHAGASTLATCVKIGAILATLISLPVLAYGAVYGVHYPTKLMGLDYGHSLIGYCIVGGILSLFRGKDTAATST